MNTSSSADLIKFNDMKYRTDIDGLRAIAVLSVVGFHAFGVKGGFVGVDIFFVISGFLISTILLTNLENNKFSFIHFYAKRIRRIFPALILTLFVSFIIGWFVLLPDEYKQLGKHVAGASVFISNFLLWNESGYFDKEAIYKPLLHLWSLGVEEQFYILWPLLLWTAWKKKFNFVYLIVAITLISFLLNAKGVRSDSVAAFYSPQTRFWELLSGSFIAWLLLFNHKKNVDTNVIPFNSNANRNLLRNVLSFSGVLLIIFCLVALSKDNYFLGPLGLIPTVGTVLIIAAGSEAWINRTILSHRTLVWFGLISFPLYLWHWPLLVFSKLSVAGGTVDQRTAKILAVAISILLAWLTYKLIETPIRFGKNNKAKTSFLVLLIGMVGALGYIAYFDNGFNFRVPKILQIGGVNNKYSSKYIMGSCFLEGDKYHFGACEMAKDASKKSILLWGDSHAAHFYAGYKKRYGKDFNIIIMSETGCRPILTQTNEANCNDVNGYILEQVKKQKPDEVVLSAAWGHHDDWMHVDKTIDQLRALGVKHIDLIGPAPDWINTLPRQLFLYSQLDKQHQIPTRMSFGLNRDFLKLDALMKELADRKKVNYISLAHLLCNEKGCMTRVGENFDDLVSLDYGHFTEYASIYLVSKFPKVV